MVIHHPSTYLPGHTLPWSPFACVTTSSVQNAMCRLLAPAVVDVIVMLCLLFGDEYVSQNTGGIGGVGEGEELSVTKAWV